MRGIRSLNRLFAFMVPSVFRKRFSHLNKELGFHQIRNVLYYVMMCFALNNIVIGNVDAALIFGSISLLVFAIPVQLTASKINRMSRLVNAVTKEDNEHFKH